MDTTLGFKIRAIRRLADKPGYALAREIGRSAGWVSLVERGHFTPSEQDLARIARALNVPVASLR